MNFALLGWQIAERFVFPSNPARENHRSAVEELLEEGRRRNPRLSPLFAFLLLLIGAFKRLWGLLAVIPLNSLRGAQTTRFVNDSKLHTFVRVSSDDAAVLPEDLTPASLRNCGFRQVDAKTADLVEIENIGKQPYTLYVTVFAGSTVSCISHPIDRYSTVVLKDGSVTVARNETLPNGSLSESGVTVRRSASAFADLRNRLWLKIDRFRWQWERSCPRYGLFVANDSKSAILGCCALSLATNSKDYGSPPGDFASGPWTKIPATSRTLFEVDVSDSERRDDYELRVSVFCLADRCVYEVKKPRNTASVVFPGEFRRSQRNSHQTEIENLEQKLLTLRYE